MTDVRVMKAALRERMAGILKALSSDQKQIQSQAILKKLLEHSAYANARRVSLYLSNASEVNTIPVLQDAFQKGKTVFVPRFSRKTDSMEMLRLQSYEDYEQLPEVMWGIKQPALEDNRENAFEHGLDVVIMPGVAFTTDGKRLGHGKGYYDRFLTSYKNKFGTLPTTIVLAFREQVVDDVPTVSTDVPVDHVLHPDT